MSSLYVLYAGSELEIKARRRKNGRITGLREMFASLRNRMERRSAIRELSGLSDRMLQDIGIDRDQIEQVVDGTLEARNRASENGRRTPKPAARPVETAIAA